MKLQFWRDLVSGWTWRMAWRDTRSSRRRLLVFSLSVVFGVAALVAIGCFEKSLEVSVNEQARRIGGSGFGHRLARKVYRRRGGIAAHDPRRVVTGSGLFLDGLFSGERRYAPGADSRAGR
jgi:predicted lysophospholipase L1 biosynthesis ABC-type transport system permease subunit